MSGCKIQADSLVELLIADFMPIALFPRKGWLSSGFSDHHLKNGIQPLAWRTGLQRLLEKNLGLPATLPVVYFDYLPLMPPQQAIDDCFIYLMSHFLLAKKRVLLVIDQAGWHISKELKVPERLHLILFPSYSPELQPAERFGTLVDIIRGLGVSPEWCKI